MLKNIYVIILFTLIYSCENSNDPTSTKYSFFVAGHTYGQPGTKGLGIYPPFLKKTKFINVYNQIEFGVLTGDVVQRGTSVQWDAFYQDLNLFSIPIHIALGNHDYIDSIELNKRINKKYYSFISNNDLHLVLDSNIDNWNISGKQLQFVEKRS